MSNFNNSNANCSRVIALIDMDCFYVQVEERESPEMKGKPGAVVQYNQWKGGGLIAVNYEARAKGVDRHMRGHDAKAACPEIILYKVPELRGKADLTKYRNAGAEVLKVISQFAPTVERASIDEAYLDLTSVVEERLTHGGTSSSWDLQPILQSINQEYLDTNYVLGAESTSLEWYKSLGNEEQLVSISDAKLAIGAEIIGQIRKAVYDSTGFRCSAGIAHNKVLAKLVCGINKPNKQTVLLHSGVPNLFETIKLKKVRNLGGKLGDYLMEKFKCKTMGDVGRLSEKELVSGLGAKTAYWIYNLAQGYDDEPVTSRQLAKSIGCNKMFNGPEALRSNDIVKHWIRQLCTEVSERVKRDFEMNNRKARTLTLHIGFDDGTHFSKSCGPNVNPYNENLDRLIEEVFQVMEKIWSTQKQFAITNLGVIASKFEEELNSTTFQKIDAYFTSLKKDKTEVSSSRTPQPPQTTTSLICNVDEQPGTSTVLRNQSISGPDIIEIEPNFQQSSTSKSMHLTSERNLPSTSRSIFAPKSSEESFPLPLNPEDPPEKALTKECEKCKKFVLLWELDSHMDFHYARELHREINGLPNPNQNQPKEKPIQPVSLPKRIKPRLNHKRPNTTGSGTGSAAKRGKKEDNTSAPPRTRTLDSYFQPRNQPQSSAPAMPQ